MALVCDNVLRMFPGIDALTTGVVVFLCLLVGIGKSLGDYSFQFAQEFDKQLQIYLEIAKFIVTHVVSATIFRSSDPIRPLP